MNDIARSHEHKLGCSEIATALGLSRWKTPYQLWLEKTGRAKPENIDGLLRVELGNKLEQVVAQMYAERTGSKLARHAPTLTSERWPYLVGHLDRRIVKARRGLEIKTHLTRFTSDEWGEEGTDKVPSEYLLQSMGYLMLSGWDSWDLAVLMAGPEFRIYTIQPDRDLIRWITMGLDRFWKHVETDAPPNPISFQDAALRWPTSINKPVHASAQAEALVAELRELKTGIAGLETREKSLELELKILMEDGDLLIDDNNRPLASWKTQTSNRIDLKKLRADWPDIAEACTVSNYNRVFRLKGKKDE